MNLHSLQDFNKFYIIMIYNYYIIIIFYVGHYNFIVYLLYSTKRVVPIYILYIRVHIVYPPNNVFTEKM